MGEIKKEYLIFVIALMFGLMINMVGAVYEKSSQIDLKIDTNESNCNITIQYPNTTNIVVNEIMDMHVGYANYTINSTQTEVIGEYQYFSNCGSDTFRLTYSGKELSSASSTFYIVLFATFIFLFLITLFGIGKLPDKNATDQEGTIMKISYLKYLRNVLWFVLWMFIVAILYIVSNISFAYLEDTLVANFFFNMFKFSLGLTLPIVIIWVVYLLAQIIDDKNIRAMWERGMFPQGKI